MTTFVFIATAWGPKFGGVNSFNKDFCLGLAQLLGSQGQVFCAVPHAEESDVAEAMTLGVKLLRLAKADSQETLDQRWGYDVVQAVNNAPSPGRIDYWIGHDVITGFAALRAHQVAGTGTCVLIHHMSFESYKGVEKNDSARADAKRALQQELFSSSDALLFAVGPLLVRSCNDLSERRDCRMLIPGFPRVAKNASPDDRLVAVTFGRLDTASDRLKQGRLAAAAFGEAVSQAYAMPYCPDALRNPLLYFVGVRDDAEEAEVVKLADDHAHQAVNVLALPFDESRHTLMDRLRRANLAMMLSWHEGFGLTGWEAIAAGIPLLLSRYTGLYELIRDELHGAGLGCITTVDIKAQRGTTGTDNFSQESLAQVAAAIARIANRIPQQKIDAAQLREHLIARFGCTWRHTAQRFLAGLSQASPLVQVEHVGIDLRSFSYARHVVVGGSIYGEVLHNGPPYTDRENIVEYDFLIRQPGHYLLEVEYAAESSRPVVISIDERIVTERGLLSTTGGWTEDFQVWEAQGGIDLAVGPHRIRMERSSYFPSIRQIRFRKQPL